MMQLLNNKYKRLLTRPRRSTRHQEYAAALCIHRYVFVNSGAVFGLGQGHHGKQNKDEQVKTLQSQEEPLCHESNMTSVHFCRHKTQGNHPLLQGNDKFRQQRTGKLTRLWIGNELKAVYRVREHPGERVGSGRESG